MIGSAPAGFHDNSLWEESKKKGDAVIKKMIDDALLGTSVTVVLIGYETAYRKFVKYEIDRSIEKGNGILPLRVHNISGNNRLTDSAGPLPQPILDGGYLVRTWNNNASNFSDWIEHAYATR